MSKKIYSFGINGVEGFLIEIETSLDYGIPSFDIVGLPDLAVKESRNRIRSAIKNSGFYYPEKKITVNLAPASIKKEGAMYDLPILISLLIGSGQINVDLDDCAFLGEVSLFGELRPINGVLPMAIEAKRRGIKNFFVPKENGAEAAILEGIDVYCAQTVKEVFLHLKKEEVLLPTIFLKEPLQENIKEEWLDFKDVKGQFKAKRALEIAAAGGHNVLMVGPPGSGKSMLAKRIPSILPKMTFEEAIDTAKVNSVVGLLKSGEVIISNRPFRAPHHTISSAGLVGGGSNPRPGEISLAHNGVIFLDELPEFSRASLEVLRQPLEDDTVCISRARGTVSYPCSVMFVAAMNPCPCGNYSNPQKKCICSAYSILRYLSKVSGPLLDRIDIHVEVEAVDFSDLSEKDSNCESSAKIKERVNRARKIQIKRTKELKKPCYNAKLSGKHLLNSCVLSDDAMTLLKKAFDAYGFSARAYDKILKISRTIADLEESEEIKPYHVAEAVQYRALDKNINSIKRQ